MSVRVGRPPTTVVRDNKKVCELPRIVLFYTVYTALHLHCTASALRLRQCMRRGNSGSFTSMQCLRVFVDVHSAAKTKVDLYDDLLDVPGNGSRKNLVKDTRCFSTFHLAQAKARTAGKLQ